jgi:hypothetical protein
MYKNYWTNREWTYEDLVERYTKKNSYTGCYEWQGQLNDKGYGRIEVEAKRWAAHRFAYTLKRKEPAKHQQVQHKCNNPPCINVQHLTLGTNKQNVDYMVKCGRQSKREKNGRAVLTSKSIEWVKKMRLEGWTILEIAIVYGVSESAISHILKNRNWKIKG